MRLCRFILAILCGIGVAILEVTVGVACAAEPLEKVAVQLSWKYQYQFAAVIAAKEKGFYRQTGLDVTIQEGGPGIDPVTLVTQGQADYGIFSSALVVEYARGKPVVALATLSQHSSVAVIARSDGRLRSVLDLAGKSVAVSTDTRDEIVAYLAGVGIGNRVNIVAKTRFGLDNLSDADAISAYVGNEGFLTKGHENEYLLFSPRTAGIDLFGNILFTTRLHLQRHGAQVKRFRAATLRGLEYALNHREEIVDLILAHYNTQNKSRDHLLYEANKLWELTRPDIIEPGYMSPGRWRHVADVYADLGKVPRDLDLSAFIYDPNPKSDAKWLYWVLAAMAVVLLIVLAVLGQFGRLNRRLQREIHDRQQSETQYRASEARFRELFEKNPDPCWLIEGDAFVECNEAAVQILGYPSREALLAIHPAEVSPEYQPDERPSREKADEMMAIAKMRGVHRFEWLHRRCDGSTFPVEVTLARYEMAGRDGLYCVWRDISERKRAERMKNEFISTVSHELRTPLTSLLGALGLLTGGAAGEMPAKSLPLLEIANNNAKRLLSLINDILDISKIEAGRLEYHFAPLEVMPFVEQAVAANEHYGARHQVSFVIGQRLEGAWVEADSNRLMQVMYNLLSNAAKFSHPSSSVEIDVGRSSGNVVISVRDHGSGIPLEFQPRVFDKFSQADSSDTRRIGGTGLGLNIARKMVLAHRGTIDFESTPGHGTLFRVTLPEYQPATNEGQRDAG